jgi:sulfatase modifying factor 1
MIVNDASTGREQGPKSVAPPEPVRGREAPPVAPLWAKLSLMQRVEAARRGVPPAFENVHGMRFVLVPAGTFLMGSPETEADRGQDEGPCEVTLTHPYYVQITEVTNAQYRRWSRSETWQGVHDSGEFRQRSLDGWDQPAVGVTWEKATAFASWLSKEDGVRRYALPTEAEWEYACRAGSKTTFWWGDTAREIWRYANTVDHRAEELTRVERKDWQRFDGYRVSAPGSSFQASAWGLYDMSGNVWEWCADRYGAYPAGRVSDPTGPLAGPERVLRGGSFIFGPCVARSAARARNRPDARSVNVGFRLVSPLP